MVLTAQGLFTARPMLSNPGWFRDKLVRETSKPASFLNARASRAVTEAHDPPARGAAIDRVYRGSESYAKDWKPLSLGTLTLAKGRGPLTLRALKIPGQHAIEVRYILLTRKS